MGHRDETGGRVGASRRRRSDASRSACSDRPGPGQWPDCPNLSLFSAAIPSAVRLAPALIVMEPDCGQPLLRFVDPATEADSKPPPMMPRHCASCDASVFELFVEVPFR